MSNAKLKRDMAKHMAWRNREMPSKVDMVSRPHERTLVAVGAKTLFCKSGKPRKRKGCIVSVRKYEATSFATSVEVSCSVGERHDYLWTGPRLGRV